MSQRKPSADSIELAISQVKFSQFSQRGCLSPLKVGTVVLSSQATIEVNTPDYRCTPQGEFRSKKID